jgi:hypothetical protein
MVINLYDPNEPSCWYELWELMMKFLLGEYKWVLAWDFNIYESHQYKTNIHGKLVSTRKRTFQTLSRHLNVDKVACTYRSQNYSRDNMCWDDVLKVLVHLKITSIPFIQISERQSPHIPMHYLRWRSIRPWIDRNFNHDKTHIAIKDSLVDEHCLIWWSQMFHWTYLALMPSHANTSLFHKLGKVISTYKHFFKQKFVAYKMDEAQLWM